MPEFLQLLPPDEARARLFSELPAFFPQSELIESAASLGRVTAEAVVAPHPMPEFPRSTVDGYAVRASDTHGASDAQPAYLKTVGEVLMGRAAGLSLGTGECAVIYTGGMLPLGSTAVVMVENTQVVQDQAMPADPDLARAGEVEILRAVAEGENTISVGEDVLGGSVVIPVGRSMRPAEIGGVMALGIMQLRVAMAPRIALISSGDEIVEPRKRPGAGQVRDVNTGALAALIERSGGIAAAYGIVRDDRPSLTQVAAKALRECDVVVITAGSSASVRDMTAQVIESLGKPGVLIHGINTRPGKPTILAVCNGKAVLGLPGNPVSALVNGYLFLVPLIERLQGLTAQTIRTSVTAELTVNLASQAGREDWWPVKLSRGTATPNAGWKAEPIFGKSNLIFTLVAAEGLLRIPADATGFSAGELVEVFLL